MRLVLRDGASMRFLDETRVPTKSETGQTTTRSRPQAAAIPTRTATVVELSLAASAIVHIVQICGHELSIAHLARAVPRATRRLGRPIDPA